MPALNYQERFAPKVESGEKRQTIRPKRKREIKPGDTLYHKTGMRTKRCRHLKTDVCLGTYTIILHHSFIETPRSYNPSLTTDDDIAKADGFDSWPEMREWFDKRYGLPFEGVLITW